MLFVLFCMHSDLSRIVQSPSLKALDKERGRFYIKNQPLLFSKKPLPICSYFFLLLTLLSSLEKE